MTKLLVQFNSKAVILSEIFSRIRRFDKYMPLLLLVGAAIIVGCGYSVNRDAINAYGWSPVGYTYGLADSGTRNYNDFDRVSLLTGFHGNSSVMRIYPLMYRVFGVEPSTTQLFFIIITSCFYAVSIFFFLKSFFAGCDRTVSSWGLAATSLLPLLIPIIDGDLARFGQANLSLGQMYSMAIPLQLIAISLALRKKTLASGFVLGILSSVHISIAVMTTAVVIAIVFCRRSAFCDWRNYSVVLFPLVCGGVWGFGVCHMTEGSYPRLALSEWFTWERMQNYHFFPLEGEIIFDTLKRAAGIAALAVVGFASPFRQMKLNREIFFASMAIVALTISGFFFSTVPISEKLTMLALHRSTGMLLFFLYALGLLFVTERAAHWDIFDTVFAGLAINHANKPVTLIFIAVGWIVFVRFDIAKQLSRIPKLPAILSLLNRVSKVAFCCVLLFVFIHQTSGIIRKQKRSGDEYYLQAQLWARDNTPVSAIFFPPPQKIYGASWSEYSRRANYGLPRDWLHTPLCYLNNAEAFGEGKRRLKCFGLDAETLKNKYRGNGVRTVDDIQQDFYDSIAKWTAVRWIAAADQEKIDYIVFQKSHVPSGLRRIYENPGYVICVPEICVQRADK